MIYVLYNPLSNNERGFTDACRLRKIESGQMEFIDITKIDILTFYSRLKSKDEIIISGGDGTLNYFVNAIYDNKRKNRIRFFKSGTGNDFARDVMDEEHVFIDLNEYIENLPKVYVNGMEKYFLNGIGYGVDGFCCEYADEIRAKSNKSINYSMIALKGLLYAYKNKNAKVTVDGVTKEFTNVMLAASMNGRFYGGGVKIAPSQNRLDKKGTLTLIVVHDLSALRALTIFPFIYSGKHTKYDKYVTVFEGHNITVEYDEPAPLQIDGETVRNVSKYVVTKDEVTEE